MSTISTVAPPARPNRARIVAVVQVALLAAGIWALRRETRGLTFAAFVARLQSYGALTLLLAVALTAVSFLLLGGVEGLALRGSGGRPASISRRTVFITAFVSHGLGNAVGVVLLTGSAVRLHAYGRRGLSDLRLAQVSTLVTLAITLGLTVMAVWATLTMPFPVVIAGHALPLRVVGTLAAVAVVAFFAWTAFSRAPTSTTRNWRLPRPTPGIALAQLGLSAADWLATSAVFFVLLPPEAGLSLLAFTRLYVVAQVAAMLSHVPAGAGVLEVVLLGLLMQAAPAGSRAGYIAAMLAFRAVYYLLPLVVALIVAAFASLRTKHEMSPVSHATIRRTTVEARAS